MVRPTRRPMMRMPVRMAGAGLLGPFLEAAAIGAVGLPSPVAAQHLEVPVHDPVMIRAEGTYYLFTTGRGTSAWSSPDMETWERLPPVFTEAPAWTEEVVPGFGERNHMWAPDIIEREGTFFLYYSVSAFGRNTSAIGVATNATLDPDHPDHGWVTEAAPSSSPGTSATPGSATARRTRSRGRTTSWRTPTTDPTTGAPSS